jgi:hypothetical protein
MKPTVVAIALLLCLSPSLSQSVQTYEYQTLDPPGSTYSISYGINNSGQAVGFYVVDSTNTRLFITVALTQRSIKQLDGPSTLRERYSAGSVATAPTNGRSFMLVDRTRQSIPQTVTLRIPEA